MISVLLYVTVCISVHVAAQTEQQSGEGCEATAILNADGVYLATYSALLLNLKLMYRGYYASQEKSLPMSEVWLWYRRDLGFGSDTA